MINKIEEYKKSNKVKVKNKDYLVVHSRIHTLYRRMNKGLILNKELKDK